MSQKIEALRGMEDLLPGEIEKWQWVEEKARIFFESRGFKEIRTPLLEYTELFTRSVGEASDIVHKEMFSFEDRGGRNVTLRPEMTASVARAVIEKGLLTQAKSLRFYYIGPMFRAERPQAGRKRQFHQIGIEIINEAGVEADFEVISLLDGFLHFVGLKNFKMHLNDLGDAENQKKFKIFLHQFFSSKKSKLCADCHYRLEKNVLRIFDCKNDSCVATQFESGWNWDEISPRSELFYKLGEKLDAHTIPFQDKRRLVRGLDYYNGIVFEACAEGLGAQDAVAGGGRYDRLYADLGGPPAPCTGFSLGVERLIAALESQDASFAEKIAGRRVYLAPLEPGCKAAGIAHETALRLREKGFRIETLKGETSLSKHLKKADRLGIRFVLILGADEIAKGEWTVKDMKEKKQLSMNCEALTHYLDTGV